MKSCSRSVCWPWRLPMVMALALTFSVSTSAQVRTIDGSNNNLSHPEWGAAHTPLLRVTAVEYDDGLSTPVDPADRSGGSVRVVSNVVCDQAASVPNFPFQASDFVWQWGQFLDHDIDLTENADPLEPLDIEIPFDDMFFVPFTFIEFNRSAFLVDLFGVRQQENQITTWIDGSNVYGSDQARADELRTFSGGRLKTSAGNLLPFNVNGFPNAGGPDPTLFLAGDVRANEQNGLTAMHTLFVREHNHYADMFSAMGMNDEQAYQNARVLVWAELQAITYREFLPILLGGDAISGYEGYDPNVDPSITNFFSTASYRFGHSMLNTTLLRLDSGLDPIPAGNLPLMEAFFAPQEIIDHGLDPLLRGLANQLAQTVDTQIVDDVRNFLFDPVPADGGFDLASLNMQRGRDHGLADYNQARVDFGLAPKASIADISSDPAVVAALQAAYPGGVETIDGWIGGLAEDHVPGALVGELVRAVLTDQFEALRNGDRFWYENVLPRRMSRFVNRQKLSRIIKRNSGIGNELHQNAFKVFN